MFFARLLDNTKYFFKITFSTQKLRVLKYNQLLFYDRKTGQNSKGADFGVRTYG